MKSDNSPQTVGGRLAALMKSRNMTQDELAKQLNYSRGYIDKWIHDKRDIPSQYAVKICELFNVDFHYLLKGVPAQNETVVTDLGLSNESIEFLKAITVAEKDQPFPIRWTDGYAPGEEIIGTSPININGRYTVESVYPAEIRQVVNWLLSHTEGRELLSFIHRYLFANQDNCWLSASSPNYGREISLYPPSEWDICLQDEKHKTLIEPSLMVYAMKQAVDSKMDEIRGIIKKEAADNAEETR